MQGAEGTCWEAGAAERADEEPQAAMAEWPGTHSSNEIPLTMLCSTRLRGMSNVIPTRPTRGPVHGWSISNLVRQADIDVSERETGAMRKVSLSSLLRFRQGTLIKMVNQLMTQNRRSALPNLRGTRHQNACVLDQCFTTSLPLMTSAACCINLRRIFRC